MSFNIRQGTKEYNGFGLNEEWMNRSENLRELEDSLIPSSQSSIDWRSSDEDSDVQCLTVPSKVNKAKTIVRKPDSYNLFLNNRRKSTKLPNSPVLKKISTSTANPQSISLASKYNASKYPSSTAILKTVPNQIANGFGKVSHQNKLNSEIAQLNSARDEEIVAVLDKTRDSENESSNSVMRSPILKSQFNIVPSFGLNMKNSFVPENLNITGVKLNCKQSLFKKSRDPSAHPTSPVFSSHKKNRYPAIFRHGNQYIKNSCGSFKRNIQQDICLSDSDKTSENVNGLHNFNSTASNLPFRSSTSGVNYFSGAEINVSCYKIKNNALKSFKDPKTTLLSINESAQNSIIMLDESLLTNKKPEIIKKGCSNHSGSVSECSYMSIDIISLGTDAKQRKIESKSFERSRGKFMSSTNNDIKFQCRNNSIAKSVAVLKRVDSCIENTSSTFDKDFSEQFESSYKIDNISSPGSDRQKQTIIEDSKSLNSGSQNAVSSVEISTESHIIDRNKRKGSDWIKDINLNKTPERTANLYGYHESQVDEPPDSSKKKFKKEGHADHLKKLLQSWKSGISMWNHQMAQIESSVVMACSDSHPINNNPSLIEMNVPLESKFIHSPEVASAQQFNSVYSPMLGKKSYAYDNNFKIFSNSLENSGIVSYSPSVSKHQFLNNRVGNSRNNIHCNASPKMSQTNKLKKLHSSHEVSPALSASLSSCKNFFVPQKHICLQITSISNKSLSSETVSVECREIDNCYNQSTVDRKAEFGFRCSSSIGSETDFGLNDEQSAYQAKKRTYFVLLSQFGNLNSKYFHIGDEIKIFAPWEVMDVGKFDKQTIFSSYFVIKPTIFKETKKFKADDHMKNVQKKIQLASWSCSCISENLVVPSLCDKGILKLFDNKPSSSAKEIKVSEKMDFNCILDGRKSNEKISNRVWTVLDAIEESGGMPDVFVQVTVHILRIIPSRDSSDVCHSVQNDQPLQFVIVGQDPSGTFLIIIVPNRPMTSTLQTLLDEGEGSIQTLSNLLVCHRMTNSQDPFLFSLIRYLHRLYKEAVQRNSELNGLLKDLIDKPLQTFCYKFSVTLGNTKHKVVSKMEGLPFKDHIWSMEEALSRENCDQRGKLILNILYYLHPYIYVTCMKRNCEGKQKENLGRIYRLIVKSGIWLPPWIGCNGTIMASAIIRDVLMIKGGGLCVDMYSSVITMNTGFKLSCTDLLMLVPNLQRTSTKYDLVVAEGFIKEIMNEDSYAWQECEFCNHHELSPHLGILQCQKCGNKNDAPLTNYCMEVVLFNPITKIESVKIKLFQKTIKGLLEKCEFLENVAAYNSSSLIGKKMKPLVCIVKSVTYGSSSAGMLFNLTELPY